MSTNLTRWSYVTTITLMLALLLFLSVPVRASAASAERSSSNSCLSCHEDLYYLHDLGKDYCLAQHAEHCVNCHQGNPAAMDKAASHQGMIAAPQQDNGQKCSQCHAQDAQAHLETFASMAGYQTVAKTNPYTPRMELEDSFPVVSESPLFFAKLPWIGGAIVLFGVWVILVLASPVKP